MQIAYIGNFKVGEVKAKEVEEIVGKVGDTIVLVKRHTTGAWYVALRTPSGEICDTRAYRTKYHALDRAVATVRKLLKERGEI
ncbi:MAG: hypothetical protein QW650_00185 [Thermofilum sp.]